MKFPRLVILMAFLAALSGCSAPLEGELATWVAWDVDSPAPAVFELAFLVDRIPHPIFVGAAPGDTDHLYVASQSGLIVRMLDQVPEDDAGYTMMREAVTTVLDLRDKVVETYEQGLLGMAFHPNADDPRPVFVSYTRPDNTSVIARYAWSEEPPRTIDAESESIVLELAQPYADHNGGHIAFGPDGYLYASFGDGGWGGDPHANGQNPHTLLGTIIRIDIDADTPYAIPADNPFHDGVDGAPEVWAFGLRNPWRFTFDRLTGDLYIADVGQDGWEEVNFMPAGSRGGANFGWSAYEGLDAYPPGSRVGNAAHGGPITPPLVAYDHSRGCAVTAGVVYRGAQFPELQGTFLFSDYCKGAIWGLSPRAAGPQTVTTIHDEGRPIPYIGEDADGELLIIDHGGVILRARAVPVSEA